MYAVFYQIRFRGFRVVVGSAIKTFGKNEKGNWVGNKTYHNWLLCEVWFSFPLKLTHGTQTMALKMFPNSLKLGMDRNAQAYSAAIKTPNFVWLSTRIAFLSFQGNVWDLSYDLPDLQIPSLRSTQGVQALGQFRELDLGSDKKSEKWVEGGRRLDLLVGILVRLCRTSCWPPSNLPGSRMSSDWPKADLLANGNLEAKHQISFSFQKSRLHSSIQSVSGGNGTYSGLSQGKKRRFAQ